VSWMLPVTCSMIPSVLLLMISFPSLRPCDGPAEPSMLGIRSPDGHPQMLQVD
jgi:hypothetical protein